VTGNLNVDKESIDRENPTVRGHSARHASADRRAWRHEHAHRRDHGELRSDRVGKLIRESVPTQDALQEKGTIDSNVPLHVQVEQISHESAFIGWLSIESGDSECVCSGVDRNSGRSPVQRAIYSANG